MEISVARKLLEALRDDLDKSILVLQAEHPRARGGGMEAGDAGANLTEADRCEAAVESARSQRTEVMGALARVEDGSYGKCVDCGQQVPDGRLEARPTTARCVACQGKRDRKRRLSPGGCPPIPQEISNHLLIAEMTSWPPTESSALVRSSASTRRPKLPGSRASR